MDSLLISLFIGGCCVTVWWLLTKRAEIRYTKVRLLGLAIDHVKVRNKFKRLKRRRVAD